jgi:macrodomain Ter protein organizer (MatP/YcbG family)
MKNKHFKRRSVNLDDASFNRGKLLAEQKAISLSALIRILINDAYDQYAQPQQKRESSQSRLTQNNGD